MTVQVSEEELLFIPAEIMSIQNRHRRYRLQSTLECPSGYQWLLYAEKQQQPNL